MQMLLMIYCGIGLKYDSELTADFLSQSISLILLLKITTNKYNSIISKLNIKNDSK